MPVAILGAGQVGQSLGSALLAAGYPVRFGVPEPEKYRHLATAAEDRSVVVTTVEDAIETADLVVLATPYAAALQIARAIPQWTGRILVDATNPIAPGLMGLSIGTTSSGAEEIAKAAPTARVVKAFNTTGFENMRDPRYPGGNLFMPVAGDDAAARQRVMALAMALGFDAVDMGELKAARYLEPWAMVWIEMALKLGHGRHFGFVRMRAMNADR
ncbi:NADPH-dependent F420 reductase [Ralstonia insidiosa]|uniref:NADPH-dependent F420 reductase n=1 Tax=Ralstonia insidiosa TaxID=190721 RepID=A0A848NZX9_9RALS|nr:NADPH-dependent F420 reductase [Ralstonia insidiosa]NMV37018.1 NADPH-dependent F420 reductase [Ralstonia insidiosa]